MARVQKVNNGIDYHLTEGEYEVLQEAKSILDDITATLSTMPGMLSEAINLMTTSENIEKVCQNELTVD